MPGSTASVETESRCEPSAAGVEPILERRTGEASVAASNVADTPETPHVFTARTR